ncbi:TrkA family potassium uptake protein [Rhodococcus sp. BGS-1C]|uniref:potassium channel family protein n=1 Tax=unclassified Rhodococcus (in: high G+C Gram-positive bacteria) TaxID=192944 RepID=UPI000B30005D|nr:TrkA family potassium uptake protein [Rhodococcus sp. KRD197]
MARNKRSGTRVVVIGLGRFGASLGRELCGHGSEVLGLDTDAHRVQRYADELTHTAIVDSTDVDALAQLGVPDFGHAVVAIGSDLESSILTTSLLSDFGIENIWAKATSRQHGKILERVGAHHVVLPEHDMGERVAHLVTGRMLDYIEFEEDYAMVKTLAPQSMVGRTLRDSDVRQTCGITVVGIKHRGADFTHAAPESVIEEGDLLICAGRTAQVEFFADLR